MSLFMHMIELGMRTNTSWQNVHKSYSENIGENGSYFHEHVIFPNLEKILDIDSKTKILDLACGEGVLSRYLKGYSSYLGLDISKGLIEQAKRKNTKENVEFEVKDVSKRIEGIDNDFTHATVILALQNIENPYMVMKNASDHLIVNGKFVVVLNHPYFRIPKSTSWELDTRSGHQFRKVFRYLSSHKVRIDMNPGLKSKEYTYSYHYSLSDYTHMLKESGFIIESIDEWISDRESQGRYAETENFTRKEFPLFMCIICRKNVPK